jgi:phospholipid N-methyltransferase
VNSPEQGEALLDELIVASQKALVLRAFVELGVADLLSGRVMPVVELAGAVGAPSDTLGRFLRASSSVGLCSEVRPDEFELSAAGDLLRTDAEGDLTSWVTLMTAPWLVRPWESLSEAVRTGGAVFPAVHGTGFWDYVAAHPQEAAIFDAAMTSGAAARADDLTEAIDLSAAQSVVDVGGGQGLLVNALLAHFPQLKGVVVDRPEVINDVTQATSDRYDRLEFVAGDFFHHVPAGHDIYLLSRILHDWPDREAVAVLQSCRRAMTLNSTLCLLEQVTPSMAELNHSDRTSLALKDLNMLVLVGGQERTLEEYRRLLAASELSIASVHHGRTCDVIEAVPVG